MRWAVLAMLAACTTSKSADPCTNSVRGQAGTLQMGTIGPPFTPIVDGQALNTQVGAQGLMMFVVSARVSGIDVSASADGGVQGAAHDGSGMLTSFDLGCRAREFADAGDGSQQLVEAYAIPLDPNYSFVGGTPMTLSMHVIDRKGQEAVDTHTIIAH